MQVLVRCGISSWHARPCGDIAKFCTDNKIRGFCKKDNKTADVRSITDLFRLVVKFNNVVYFYVYGDKEALEKFKEFIKEF